MAVGIRGGGNPLDGGRGAGRGQGPCPGPGRPEELAGCLLAWGCAGAELPAANGAPLRLVAPDRRGLDWVKWVGEVQPATRT